MKLGVEVNDLRGWCAWYGNASLRYEDTRCGNEYLGEGDIQGDEAVECAL